MSTHNIGFYEDLTNIYLNYHQISSNAHLISSAETVPKMIWLIQTILFTYLRHS